MKKLTTKLMIGAAVFVVVAGAATAETMTAEIPFAFRAGKQVLPAGTYRVDNEINRSITPIFRLTNLHSRRTATLVVPQAPVYPKTAWKHDGNPKMAFECAGGRCALAQVWTGPGSYAYTFARPSLGKGETAELMVVPMHRGKGE